MAGDEVTVLVFGPLRERVGLSELHVRGRTVREVWDAVVRVRPAAAVASSSLRAARNLEYCDWNTTVEPGDTIAFIPPVAGGSSDTPVRAVVTSSPIDVAAVLTGLGTTRDGAVAVFVGSVRSPSGGADVSRIDYEAYGEMAESEMRRIGTALHARGGIGEILMVHRVGTVGVGEASVVVAVAAPHRDAAFAACEEAIELIKATVPIWKREHRDDGVRWVDAHPEAASSRA